MTFEQVLVFHKIVQSGSFKSAAAELHKTQPAISLAIKKLEEGMEVDLFDRSNYRPSLTEHGKAFYEKSLKVLQGMSELESLSQSFRKKEEPQINIALDGIFLIPKLLRLFKSFSDQFPNTKLNISFDILSEAEKRVLDRDADIGITHFVSDIPSLEIVPLTSIRMLPVMGRELFKSKNVKSQKDLLQIEQVVVADKLSSRKMSFGLLEGGKKWRLKDINFKREIIFAGLGWGHLPEHSIERELRENKLVVLNFDEIHPRELMINLIRHKRFHQGPVAKILWEALTQEYTKGP